MRKTIIFVYDEDKHIPKLISREEMLKTMCNKQGILNSNFSIIYHEGNTSVLIESEVKNNE